MYVHITFLLLELGADDIAMTIIWLLSEGFTHPHKSSTNE